MAALARLAPAPQDSAKTDTTWLLQKVRKILDTTKKIIAQSASDIAVAQQSERLCAAYLDDLATIVSG